MKPLKRGMVVDADLNPTLGSETGKVRPCIVVTNDVYNERVPVIQVAQNFGNTGRQNGIYGKPGPPAIFAVEIGIQEIIRHFLDGFQPVRRQVLRQDSLGAF